MFKINSTFKFFKLYKNELLWTSVGQLLTVLGSFFALKTITQRVSPDIYGLFTLGLTISLGINQILFGPLASGLHRFQYVNTKKGIFIRQVWSLIFYSIAILLIVYLVCFYFNLIKLDKKLIALVFLYSIIFGIQTIFLAIEEAKRNRKFVSITRSIEPWLRAFLIIIIIRLFLDQLDGLLYGYLITSVIILIFLLSRFPKPRLQLKKTSLNSIIKYTAHNSIFGLFTWLHLSSDKWILQYVENYVTVSSYTVIYQLGFFPMVILGGVINQFVSPILYQRIEKNQNIFDSRIINISFLIIILSIFISIIFYFNHKFILHLFVDEEYLEYSFLTCWLVLSGGIYSAGHLLTILYQYKLQTKSLMYGKIITSLFGVMTNVLLTLKYNIYGLIGSMIIYSVFHYIYFFMKSKFNK